MKSTACLITLPNFGDEKGVLEAVRRSELKVPILIHAEPDEPAKWLVKAVSGSGRLPQAKSVHVKELDPSDTR